MAIEASQAKQSDQADQAKRAARERIEQERQALVDLSHRIHAEPEVAFAETQACLWVTAWLSRSGFDVRPRPAGLETAVSGTIGPGPLHVLICAEYDALPAVGHACGHNIIAAAAVGAGVALATVAEAIGLRVTVLGTPAEEGGAGKAVLLEGGAFEGVHAALMIHPAPLDILEPHVLAAQTIDVAYHGREAHAAAYPELGVNAADALVVAQAAIGLLRQHLRPTDRVHGIVTKGGDAPNIVPAHTSARYMVRARTLDELQDVRDKVVRCFEAGAHATGASLELEARAAYAHMLHDRAIADVFRRNAAGLGRRFEHPSDALGAFSTDMGNVSLSVPSIHPMLGIDSLPSVMHQPGFQVAAASPAGDRAIFDGAVAMAWTAIDLATDDALRSRLLGSEPVLAG